MEQLKQLFPQTVDKKVERIMLAFKLVNGQAVTEEIPQDKLPLYLEVASTTGFKVEKIADEGEEFPFRDPLGHEMVLGPNNLFVSQLRVSSIRVKKGNMGVSIKIAKDNKGGYSPFWDKLRILEQKKV